MPQQFARYRWSPADMHPPGVNLIDTAKSVFVATITVDDEGQWIWQRETDDKLYDVRTGIAGSMSEAKRQVIESFL